jgi:formylglycine-generating enzyme required for sulfatase activity
VLAETLRNQFRGKYLSLEQTEKELQEEISILNNRFGKPRQTPHIRCESAQRVSLNFLPSSLIAKKIGLEKTNSRRKSRTERRSKKDLISLKSEALKAETAGQFELAKDLWHQLLLASPSQQDSYFKAIKRIAEAEVNLNHYTFYKKVIKNEEDKASQSTVNNNKSLSFELNVNNVTLKQSNLFRFESIYLDYDGKNIDRSTGEAQLFAEILDATSIEMILIPGGSFLMGSSHAKANPNELPAHIVTLDYSFMMSKYPITKGQWREVAKLQKINQDLPMRTCLQGGINHPVVNVSWNEAVEFCGRLAHKTGNIYRLPTEAEWEYACRAKTTTLFHFGHSINSNLANFEAQNLEPVGKFPFANQYGLFDMHGNIWEWCQDNWHENYYGAPTDGSPWLDSELSHNRLLRGGSWQNESGLCRSASRMFDHANSKSNNIGFRIASLI